MVRRLLSVFALALLPVAASAQTVAVAQLSGSGVPVVCYHSRGAVVGDGAG